MVADSVNGGTSSRTNLTERKNRPRLGAFSCGCDVEGMLLTVGAGVFPLPDPGRPWAKLDIVTVRARNKRTTCGDFMAGPQCVWAQLYASRRTPDIKCFGYSGAVSSRSGLSAFYRPHRSLC